MTTPTPPGTPLGTISGYGYEFAATGEPDSMVLTRMSTHGQTHATGQLTWDAAQDAFAAEWNPEAFPRIEPDSLLAMHLLRSVRQLRAAVAHGEPLPGSSAVRLAQPLPSERVHSILDKGANQ
ncbi:hypothetical protein O1R50_08925 [Glycomyces luteolus]|uniref:Uncharacterized protein n=1 Tax=Glycomyces luteolus TaxID=2670330 RepID=A0A9X3ST09_9ACTN|nr:hypothetical protein [Glycomyces luteolus]MDA1359743.1 hypothetical protein [Glycomyces luteolus]